jgi:hypothetical protein
MEFILHKNQAFPLVLARKIEHKLRKLGVYVHIVLYTSVKQGRSFTRTAL